MGDEAVGGRHCDEPSALASTCSRIPLSVVSDDEGRSPERGDFDIVSSWSRLAGPPRLDSPGVVIVFKLKGKLDLRVKVSSSCRVHSTQDPERCRARRRWYKQEGKPRGVYPPQCSGAQRWTGRANRRSFGGRNGNKTARRTTATAHPTFKLALQLKGERGGVRSQMEISILIWDHDLFLRDDSCVYVALHARVSPHEECPRGLLNIYCRSSTRIGWLVFPTGP